MSPLRTTFTTSLRPIRCVPATATPRSFSHAARVLATQPPPGNHPPSAQQAGKQNHVSTDTQSNASQKDPDEAKTGDDHPAKQPDPQPEPTRDTGFQNVKGEVKGGKESLDQRSDKQ